MQYEQVSRMGAFKATETYQVYDEVYSYEYPNDSSRNYQETFRKTRMINRTVEENPYKYVNPLKVSR